MQRLVFLTLAGLLIGCAFSASAQEDALDQFILVEEAPDRELFPTGALPADPDEYLSLPATPLYRDFLPAAVDLSDRFPTPGDQGDMGSCVAWAVGYAARSYYAHAREGRRRNAADHVPSPAYIYHSIRSGDCDGGSQVPAALALLKQGSVSLAAMPYSDRSCRRVSEQMRRLATDFRIQDYRRVDFSRPDQVKAQLAAGHPVVFAFGQTPKSFHKARAGRTYRWDGRDRASGGHAMTVVGYDDRRQAFRVINSWGRKWGDQGFIWVDYESFKRLTVEAYVMVPTEIPVPTPRPDDPAPDVEGFVDIAGLRCSRLESRTEAGATVLAGFVGYARDLERLREAVKDKPIRLEVELRPWPQCEVLLTLGDTLSRPGAPGLAVAEGRPHLAAGEVLPISVETPGQPTYLYLSYIQADGSVVNLHQPTGLVPSPLPAYRNLAFGTGAQGSVFKVSPPFGREMVIAVTSKSPLFDAPLPRIQTEREYLTAMRKALLAIPEEGGAPRVASAAVAAFQTREASP